MLKTHHVLVTKIKDLLSLGSFHFIISFYFISPMFCYSEPVISNPVSLWDPFSFKDSTPNLGKYLEYDLLLRKKLRLALYSILSQPSNSIHLLGLSYNRVTPFLVFSLIFSHQLKITLFPSLCKYPILYFKVIHFLNNLFNVLKLFK